MRFWQDRVADVGLVVLGVALPCIVALYFTWTEGRDQEEVEAAAAAELARLEWTRGGSAAQVEEPGSRAVSTPRTDAVLAMPEAEGRRDAVAGAMNPPTAMHPPTSAMDPATAAVNLASGARNPANGATNLATAANPTAGAANASKPNDAAESVPAADGATLVAGGAPAGASGLTATKDAPQVRDAASGTAPGDTRSDGRPGISTASDLRLPPMAAAASNAPLAATSAAASKSPAPRSAATAPNTSLATEALVQGGVAPPPSAAPPSPATSLAARAGALASTDADARAQAAYALSHLDHDARPALVARLLELAAHRPPASEIAAAFAALRGASTGRWSDDDVDLASGIPALLDRDRSARTLAVVEPLLYLRSLENMLAGEGHTDLALFVDLDDGAWQSELIRVRRRLGTAFAPALITMRAHPSGRVGGFAQSQLAALDCDNPKQALSTSDPDVLARMIRAYARPLDYTAMPLIVRLVGDSRIRVRQAAREAVALFGRNAIWQLRELFDEVAGQAADKHWDHEQTARELYTVLDRPRLEEAETLLARGLQSLTRGDLTTMRRDYDALLTKYPDFEHRDRLAEGYAVLAADLFRSDALADSLATYRRALRLAPDAPNARRWQARVAFVSAELSLTRGVVDLTGYKRALELDPQLREAHDAIERLSGERSEHVRNSKRLAAALAFMLLLACVVLLVRRAPTDRLSGVRTAAALPETESEPHG